eukprot:8470410-Ditylum_brightwellii.AAC.1
MSKDSPFPCVLPINNQGVVSKQRMDPEKGLMARDRDCGMQMHTLLKTTLDLFWARAKSTVASVITGIQLAEDMGIPPPYPPSRARCFENVILGNALASIKNGFLEYIGKH